MSPAANRSRRGATPVLMRGLLVLGFLLAIGAIAIAVFSDDVRLLKLAALLGVWAALATAFPVVYFRRSTRAAEQKTEESKRTYELELHREISARREYEIGVSEAAREDAETRHREELAGLREQLDRLNTTLSGLLDGDLLFERLTLSAESTRVRQVGGESGRGRLAAMARPGQIEHAPEPTGPYVGQQSAAPVAVGPPFGTAGRPYPVREDDTVQFPRATFGPGAPAPAGTPVGPSVVESAVAENVATPAPAEPAPVEPEPVVEPEHFAEPAPEQVVEPEPAVEPQPEPVAEPEPEVEPQPQSEPVPEPEVVAEISAPDSSPEVVGEPDQASEQTPAQVVEPEPAVEAVEPESAPLAPEVPTFSEPAPAELPDSPPEHADSGTGHSAGISVADLLAAYGATEGAPRRRRRAED